MDRKKLIEILTEWSATFDPQKAEVKDLAEQAYQHNKWFTTENIFISLNNIRNQFLQKHKLEAWLSE